MQWGLGPPLNFRRRCLSTPHPAEKLFVMANHGPVDLQFHTERQPYRQNWDARKSHGSCPRPQGGGIATTPTKDPKQRPNQRRTQAHERMHARTRKISEWHVGLEAQFFSWLNERELRLGLNCRVGRWGHLSRTPSGESALRWPHRPVPLQPKSRNFSHNSTACTARHQLFAKLEGESSQNLPKLGTFCPKTTTQLRLLLALIGPLSSTQQSGTPAVDKSRDLDKSRDFQRVS